MNHSTLHEVTRSGRKWPFSFRAFVRSNVAGQTTLNAFLGRGQSPRERRAQCSRYRHAPSSCKTNAAWWSGRRHALRQPPLRSSLTPSSYVILQSGRGVVDEERRAVPLPFFLTRHPGPGRPAYLNSFLRCRFLGGFFVSLTFSYAAFKVKDRMGFFFFFF